MKAVTLILLGIVMFTSCARPDSIPEDLIKKKEARKGNDITDVVITGHKQEVNDFKIFYYKANTNPVHTVQDSIMLSSTGDGIYKEVPW